MWCGAVTLDDRSPGRLTRVVNDLDEPPAANVFPPSLRPLDASGPLDRFLRIKSRMTCERALRRESSSRPEMNSKAVDAATPVCSELRPCWMDSAESSPEEAGLVTERLPGSVGVPVRAARSAHCNLRTAGCDYARDIAITGMKEGQKRYDDQACITQATGQLTSTRRGEVPTSLRRLVGHCRVNREESLFTLAVWNEIRNCLTVHAAACHLEAVILLERMSALPSLSQQRLVLFVSVASCKLELGGVADCWQYCSFGVAFEWGHGCKQRRRRLKINATVATGKHTAFCSRLAKV